MQRDMDLMRKILFKIEDVFPAGEDIIEDLIIDGYECAVVAEHCYLLFRAKLINNYDKKVDITGKVTFFIGNLTNEGYDYLDKVRDETVWNNTKDIIKDKGLPMIVDVIKDISTTVISSMVEGAIKGLKQ